jgi:hypothetical protein
MTLKLCILAAIVVGLLLAAAVLWPGALWPLVR